MDKLQLNYGADGDGRPALNSAQLRRKMNGIEWKGNSMTFGVLWRRVVAFNLDESSLFVEVMGVYDCNRFWIILYQHKICH